ncbi:hypothetical protein Vafri_18992, partial [Volvox africanus]
APTHQLYHPVRSARVLMLARFLRRRGTADAAFEGWAVGPWGSVPRSQETRGIAPPQGTTMAAALLQVQTCSLAVAAVVVRTTERMKIRQRLRHVGLPGARLDSTGVVMKAAEPCWAASRELVSLGLVAALPSSG